MAAISAVCDFYVITVPHLPWLSGFQDDITESEADTGVLESQRQQKLCARHDDREAMAEVIGERRAPRRARNASVYGTLAGAVRC